MGLDITAYRNLTVVENPILDEYGYPENWKEEWKPGASTKWSESCFPGRALGIDYNLVYRFEDSYDFRAGSYSSYNWWRDILKEFAHENEFYELIDFADNEGSIGPVVSNKLYTDFINNYDRAKEYSKLFEDGAWWLTKYENWMIAFEYAKENGAVEFY